ncbi:hypothetical protein [Shinella sp. JR1-6]|uniref:hypothetical protein n=1 Tax=Shinella sp. JR1-6 TaxID=2527671 RepID=UPI00102D4F8F|nr:hypothetical protein [Shinella sp. JR1-6]TAA54585.1 hypothetical protein EXZ48_26535 [Shinella sp. JR1-6]
MADRLSCCVPFCRRTVDRQKLDAGHNEWLCHIHWKLVPARLKRRRAKLRRLAKRTGDPARLARIHRADDAAWAACRAKAIEGAAGL